MQAEPSPVTNADDHEPAVADVPEWKRVIEERLEAVRREVLGDVPGTKRRATELGQEIQYLAMIRVWFELGGNITHAAERLGSNRRAVRDRVAAWRRSYPHLVPIPVPPPVRAPKAATGSKPRVRRRKRKKQAGELEGEARLP